MGGMIVQTIAIEHPERVRSLCSIMSTTGDPGVGQATPEAMAALLQPAPPDRDGYLDRSVETNRKRYLARPATANLLRPFPPTFQAAGDVSAWT